MSDAHDDPTLQVREDLREIGRLSLDLREQAFARADDIDVPGGDALVAIGPIANQLRWNSRRMDAEQRWWDNPEGAAPEDRPDFLEDVEGDNPLQLLLFWSEQWRADLGDDKERLHPVSGMWLGPTLVTESRWLYRRIDWIRANEAHFDDFEADVRKARRILEAVLVDGERATPGITCPECQSAALVRTELDRRRKGRDCPGHGPLQVCPIDGCGGAHDRGGLVNEWTCPRPSCGASYDQAHYNAEVMKHWVASADYLPGEFIEKRTNVPHGTVRVWAHRGHVRSKTALVTDGETEREKTVYCVADVEARFSANRVIDMPADRRVLDTEITSV